MLNELEPVRFSEVVSSFRAANVDRFSLAVGDQLAALVGPLPVRSTPWNQTFGVLHLLLGVKHGTKRSGLQNSVDAVRLIEERRSQLVAAHMRPPPLPPGSSAWPAFLDWVNAQAKAIART